ncbi:MAG: polysaccharide biosynthesis protein [Chloroflexota bacterium]
MYTLENKRILVTGGTGSLGKVLIRRLLSGELGMPKKIIVLSRDEAKQHAMRVDYLKKARQDGAESSRKYADLIDYRIGDVRDFHSVASALKDVDVVFNAAALKQVPACEYFPHQAVLTNIIGPENIVRAIQEHDLPVEIVVGISTDKACKPVNVMGMTKALQERVFIQANMRCPGTRFVCVRYGNVLASRGSVIPLFHEQIKHGGPVTITTTDMTRFLLSLDQAVDTVLAAVREGRRGETYIPRVPSAKVTDIAALLIGERPIETVVTGIRPGEKIHEILVSEEERYRTIERGRYFVILPNLPEISDGEGFQPALADEYSSANYVMPAPELKELFLSHQLLIDDSRKFYEDEFLR